MKNFTEKFERNKKDSIKKSEDIFFFLGKYGQKYKRAKSKCVLKLKFSTKILKKESMAIFFFLFVSLKMPPPPSKVGVEIFQLLFFSRKKNAQTLINAWGKPGHIPPKLLLTL